MTGANGLRRAATGAAMRRLFHTAALLLLWSTAVAECPNACSGHGACGSYDACKCHRRWQGADCSLRTCMFGAAHVDSPKGDLDGSASSLTGPLTTVLIGSAVYPHGTTEQVPRRHSREAARGEAPVSLDRSLCHAQPPSHALPFPSDGSDAPKSRLHFFCAGVVVGQYPNLVDSSGAALSDTAHAPMECSNKGLCDRKTGECECFDGYEGSACQVKQPAPVHDTHTHIRYRRRRQVIARAFDDATNRARARRVTPSHRRPDARRGARLHSYRRARLPPRPPRAHASRRRRAFAGAAVVTVVVVRRRPSQRASCPSDCNGHGTCEYISALAAREFANEYSLWDAHVSLGCACSPGWHGPDCSKRKCKYGIDPLYVDEV